MSIGKGIAIAGIWAAVGASAFATGEVVIVVALFAMFATLAVAAH